MKVVIVVAVCLLGAIAIQGRPAKLQDSSGGHEESQNVVEEIVRISLELAEQVSTDSSFEDVPVRSQTSLQQEDEDEDEELDSFESYRVPILVDLRERHEDGTYSFRIEQGDGIRRSESGAATGPDGGWQTVGEYSFKHPDGSHHELTYVADHNGFQPSSDMLPTPFPLEPWHLEQIAFAEAQKRLHAADEEGSSEGADGVTSELVADAGVGNGGLGDANIAGDAVEDASAGDISAEGIGSSRLGLSVGDASATDSGAQEFGSFGLVSSAADIGDASVRGIGVGGTEAGGSNGVESASPSAIAIFAGDNSVRDTGLSGLALFLANQGREDAVASSSSNDVVFPLGTTASEQAFSSTSASSSALSSGSASSSALSSAPAVSSALSSTSASSSALSSGSSSSSALSSAPALSSALSLASTSSSALSSAPASSSALSSASASSSALSSASATGKTSNNGETSDNGGDGGSEAGQNV